MKTRPGPYLLLALLIRGLSAQGHLFLQHNIYGFTLAYAVLKVVYYGAELKALEYMVRLRWEHLPEPRPDLEKDVRDLAVVYMVYVVVRSLGSVAVTLH